MGSSRALASRELSFGAVTTMMSKGHMGMLFAIVAVARNKAGVGARALVMPVTALTREGPTKSRNGAFAETMARIHGSVSGLGRG